jgi:hypothetical protein
MTPQGGLVKHPVGRPRARIKPEQVSQLRNQGLSWRQIAKTLRIGMRLSPRLTQTVKTQFAVRCKFLARQDDCTA